MTPQEKKEFDEKIWKILHDFVINGNGTRAMARKKIVEEAKSLIAKREREPIATLKEIPNPYEIDSMSTFYQGFEEFRTVALLALIQDKKQK